MLTFTELRYLCAESIFLKYCGYIAPLLLFLLTKHVWKLFTASNTTTVEQRKAVIDIGGEHHQHIQTDSNRRGDDDDGGSDDNGDDDDDEFKPHLPEREHIPYRGITECLDKSGEKFYKLANDRRSIRKFAKDKAVDDRVIEQCIRAAGEGKTANTSKIDRSNVNKIW